MNFCQGISERIENNPIILAVLLLNDAAHFLNGHVNKRNGFWASALSDQKPTSARGEMQLLKFASGQERLILLKVQGFWSALELKTVSRN